MLEISCLVKRELIIKVTKMNWFLLGGGGESKKPHASPPINLPKTIEKV